MIEQRFSLLSDALDERLRRLVAAAEAQVVGYGGVSLVARATDVSRRAITVGLAELKERKSRLAASAQSPRVRRSGGGRKKATTRDLTLLGDLEQLIEPLTRGDPESPLRWTCKSLRKLAGELVERGHEVHEADMRVEELLARNVPRSATDDYPFFFGDQKNRDSFLFTKNIDPKLPIALHPLVNETPAGEIESIGPQPSRYLSTQIKAPVLTLIAEEDEIFDAAGAAADEAAFVSSDDVTFTNYPGIGHGLEFHTIGPKVTKDVVSWLGERPKAMPKC